MSTKAPSTRCAARNRHTSSLQLASAIRTRRVHFLNMTVEEAAEFAGLKADQCGSLSNPDGFRLWTIPFGSGGASPEP
jgi:hypothetical protein